MTVAEETIQVENRPLVNREALRLATLMARSYLSRTALSETAYGGDRKYYTVLGYPSDITLDQYITKYKRQDIAKRIVNLPAQDSWKKPPQISEDGETETDFVNDWNKLVNKRELTIWSKISRADKLSGIGRYGILLLGFKDGRKLYQPVNTGILQKLGTDGLIYLRPFSEASLEILETEKDVKSERFGQPTQYQVTFEDEDKSRTLKVHWQRVLHLADDKKDSEIYGTPRLEAVYNRLDDITKLIGGGSEASWLNMRQGTLMRPQEGYDGSTMDRQTLADEIQEYSHDPLRMLWLEGVETDPIGRDKIMNIGPIFEVAVALISAASGIPQRVLIGSAQGELASAAEDNRQWAGEVAYRQKHYAEPEILRAFIDRMVEFGIISTYGEDGYHIGKKNPDSEEWEWPPLVQMTEKERAEISEYKSRATKNLSDPTLQYVATPQERRGMIGLPRDESIDLEITEDVVTKQMNDVQKKYMRGELSGEQVLNYAKSLYLDVRDLIATNENGE